jgi:hypothetical protein
MLKPVLIFSTLLLLAAQVAVASDREDDVSRTRKAAQVFKEIMDTPDQAIPHDLLPSFLEVTMVAEWQPVALRTAGVRRCSSRSKVGAWDTR